MDPNPHCATTSHTYYRWLEPRKCVRLSSWTDADIQYSAVLIMTGNSARNPPRTLDTNMSSHEPQSPADCQWDMMLAVYLLRNFGLFPPAMPNKDSGKHPQLRPGCKFPQCSSCHMDAFGQKTRESTLVQNLTSEKHSPEFLNYSGMYLSIRILTVLSCSRIFSRAQAFFALANAPFEFINIQQVSTLPITLDVLKITV